MGSASGRFLLSLLFLSLFFNALSQSLIEMLPEHRRSGHRLILRDDNLFCDSWRFSVETNDAGFWKTIPQRCLRFVQDYMTDERYQSDLKVVATDSLEFAKSVELAGDGKDAWIFDIDETLLSNLPYYEVHGFGSETFDERTFDDWIDLAEAPAILASLSLYKELKQMGFKGTFRSRHTGHSLQICKEKGDRR
ncbi:acid phosphatase 1-like isoform X2 [Malania oleifera]|uniref:acid phosphatase 1-like isoform X2 n=1 Tax=Malania oleifera TaxID=397392 RepID=UPI0025AE4EBF|nr:acid phosphatase 1-like isoform X2 [Malania oleifera]